MSDILAKAILDSGTNGSTGGALIPQVINPYIIELARKLSPLRASIPRKPWDNLTYTFKQRTSTIVGQSFGEDDTWQFANSGYASQTVTMKILGALGGVSNLLQEGSKLFADALSTEIESAVRGVSKWEENLLLNGNATSAPNQFNGIAASLVSNASFGAGAGAVGATSISFNMLDAMDDAVKSRGFGLDPASCFWVTTPNMATNIARLTQPYWRSEADPMNLVGGFATGVYRNHKILTSSAAEQILGVTSEVVTVTGSGSAYSGTLAHRFAITAVYDDQLGNLYNSGTPAPAPVVKANGTTLTLGTQYTITVDPFVGSSVVNFTSNPAAPVTVTYFYKQQNLFLLDFSTMCVPVLKELAYEPIPDSVQQDQKNFRVKCYEALAIEAEMGNAMALGVSG